MTLIAALPTTTPFALLIAVELGPPDPIVAQALSISSATSPVTRPSFRPTVQIWISKMESSKRFFRALEGLSALLNDEPDDRSQGGLPRTDAAGRGLGIVQKPFRTLS
jgi:hypothetical protein